ncbi:MAG: chemotaxis protein CheW, partial [Shewanella sp.]
QLSHISQNSAAKGQALPIDQGTAPAAQSLPLSAPTYANQAPRSFDEGLDKGFDESIYEGRAGSTHVNKQALEKLLAPVLKDVALIPPAAQALSHNALARSLAPTNSGLEPENSPEPVNSSELEPSALSLTTDLPQLLEDEFQVLFFKVAGLTLAVPLVSLGGIVKIERINHIIGRPSWFLGVQTYREQQLNIVDTCAWVMPEKYTEELVQTVNYQYVVLLEGSNWGLTCESLVNAVKINKTQVNWRSKAGKRPWLAGVVKQQMCGILHVQALVDMLDAGLGCQDSIN